MKGQLIESLRRMAGQHELAIAKHQEFGDKARFAPEQEVEDIYVQMHSEIVAILLDEVKELEKK